MEIDVTVRLSEDERSDAHLEAAARHVLLLLAAKLIEASIKWNGNNSPPRRNTSSS